MTVMEGMHFDVTSAQAKAHFLARADYHKDKAKDYEAKLKALAGVELSDPNSSMDPRQGLERQAESHRVRARVMQFRAEYVTPGETFRLTESDLQQLEFLDRYF